MSPILTVIPFCENDLDRTRRLLAWMAELGGCGGSPILLAADAIVSRDTIKSLKIEAARIFSHADAILVQVPPDHQGWGHATKVMFESVANQIEQCYKLPWLWCEPDCVPVKQDWLDCLTFAYHRAPKRFLGARCVPKEGPAHMAGPGVYPPDAYSTVKDFLPSNPHFDLAIAPAVLPRMTETPLIQHFWGKPDLAPTFKNGQHAESDAENLLPLSFIRPTTAIFHRNSDGTLIECLRQARAPIPCSPVAPEPDSVQDPLAEVADLPGELKINVAVPAAKPMKYKMK